jgi:hypothetical protein
MYTLIECVKGVHVMKKPLRDYEAFLMGLKPALFDSSNCVTFQKASIYTNTTHVSQKVFIYTKKLIFSFSFKLNK